MNTHCVGLILFMAAGGAMAQTQQTGPSWRTDTPKRLAPPPDLEKPEFEFSVDRGQLTQMGMSDEERADLLAPSFTPRAMAESESGAQGGTIASALLSADDVAYHLVRTTTIQPDYPSKAFRDGTEGWVDLMLTVAPDGRVIEVEVTAAEPSSVFEKAAVRAAKRWRFEPPEEAGIRQAQQGYYRVSFKI